MKMEKSGHLIFAVVVTLFLLIYSAIVFFRSREDIVKAVQKFTWTDPQKGIAEIEEEMRDHIPGRYMAVEAYGAIQMLMGKHEVDDFEVVSDRSGYLHNGNFWTGFGDDTQELALRVRRLQDDLSSKGTQVGFVLMPMKTAREGTKYAGIPYNDFSSQSDTMLRWLRYYDVQTLDMEKVLAETGLTYEETFFKTDHHWTPRAAFAGFCGIVDWMNERWDAGLDPGKIYRSPENYERLCWKERMLGSQGRKTGILYAGGREDYEAVVPRLDGEFYRMYRESDGDEKEKTGGITDTLMEMEPQGDIYKVSVNTMYLDEIKPYEHIENLNRPDGVRILMLRDSFASPVGVFMSQVCGQCDLLWTQRYGSEEIKKILQEQHYDYVIVSVYPENLSFKNFPYYESRGEAR